MVAKDSAEALFVSRAGADADFAGVIAGVLQSAGYDVTLHQWDFANRNFMQRMHAALAGGARVVALLSPEYLRSDHCQAEWQNAIAGDPLNTQSRLILLRVAECEPDGLLSGLAYWDLVRIRDDRALVESVVLQAVRPQRLDAAASGTYWRAPRTIVDTEAIRAVPSFSGRDAELRAIAVALSHDGAVTTVTGLGGVGKSSIAREYAWRNRDDYAVVWWLNALTEDGIIEALLRLGSLLARGIDQVPDRRAAAQRVIGRMLSGFAKPVLLIFDNLEEERLLRIWQPRFGSRGLVTSRSSIWSADVTAIALDSWPLETAAAYLQRESGRPDLSAGDARAIAETLGALPLALSHAAAALRGLPMVTPQRYSERVTAYLGAAPREAEYPNSVFATFSASIAQAEEQAAGAAALIGFAAFFAPDGIPDEFFRQPAELYPGKLQPVLRDDLCVDDILGSLNRLSLLAFAPSSRTYSMHRLVRLAGKDLVGAWALEWCACAIRVIDSIFPEADFAVWPQCERMLPHARAALEALPYEAELLSAASLSDRCSRYLWQRGEYTAAEALSLRALAIREKVSDRDHPDFANSLNNLAIIRWYQGRYAEAETLHARVLAAREQALGPDHPDVARSLNNLAGVYQDQGRYAEAEPLQTRVLQICQKALGPDHADVASALNNLANAYCCQGRYAEAEPLLMRALAILECTLGPEHPNVAVSLNTLAIVYWHQSRFAEAEPLLARVLAIREKALGSDHPEVASSLDNLAIVYSHQERHAESEPLHERALAIFEKVLGPDHPDVARSLNIHANLCRDQGRHGEAELLYKRALTICETALGPKHPDTSVILRDFAQLRREQGRHEEAERLLTRATS